MSMRTHTLGLKESDRLPDRRTRLVLIESIVAGSRSLIKTNLPVTHPDLPTFCIVKRSILNSPAQSTGVAPLPYHLRARLQIPMHTRRESRLTRSLVLVDATTSTIETVGHAVRQSGSRNRIARHLKPQASWESMCSIFEGWLQGCFGQR